MSVFASLFNLSLSLSPRSLAQPPRPNGVLRITVSVSLFVSLSVCLKKIKNV